MKKVLALLFAALMLLSACGPAGGETTVPDDTDVTDAPKTDPLATAEGLIIP